MRTLASALAVALCAMAAEAPRVVYTKSFPRSNPAYVKIVVERDGSTVYTEAEKDDQPLQFKLAPTEAGQIFSLADRLDHFKRPLESGLKVANMGMKTFRYEDGAESSEQRFNFSTDENARGLLDWFERITETERHYIDVERTVRFDRIGVNQALLDLAVTNERKRLVARDQFLPLLDRIAKNDSFVHIARERAATLADEIRRADEPQGSQKQ